MFLSLRTSINAISRKRWANEHPHRHPERGDKPGGVLRDGIRKTDRDTIPHAGISVQAPGNLAILRMGERGETPDIQ